MTAERTATLVRPSGGVLAAGAGESWLSSRPRPLVLGLGGAVVAMAAGVLAPAHLLDALGLVAAAAVVTAVMLRPMVGAYLLVGLVPITSGLASGFPVAHIRVSEAVIGLVGVTLVAFVRPRDAVPWQLLDWVLLAYGLTWVAFGIVADRSLGQSLGISDWGTVFGQLQFFLVYRGVRVAVRTSAERRRAVGVLVCSSVAVSALAILQELRAPGVGGFIHAITGGVTAGSTGGVATATASRVTGPFDNWAALAGYLLPVVLVLVALAVAGIRTRARGWFVGVGVLAAVALALTDEQSAIVCLVVGVVLLVRHYARGRPLMRWVMTAVVAAGLVIGPILAARVVGELSGSAGTGRISWVPQTLSFRWAVWTHQYLPAIGARPLSGYGVLLPLSVHWQYPESQYVSFLMEGGLPMLLMFGVLAWAMLGGTLRAVRSPDPMTQALGRALTILVVSMLVMDVVWPFLSNGGMPQVLWALLALTVPGGIREGSPGVAPPRAARLPGAWWAPGPVGAHP